MVSSACPQPGRRRPRSRRSSSPAGRSSRPVSRRCRWRSSASSARSAPGWLCRCSWPSSPPSRSCRPRWPCSGGRSTGRACRPPTLRSSRRGGTCDRGSPISRRGGHSASSSRRPAWRCSRRPRGSCPTCGSASPPCTACLPMPRSGERPRPSRGRSRPGCSPRPRCSPRASAPTMGSRSSGSRRRSAASLASPPSPARRSSSGGPTSPRFGRATPPATSSPSTPIRTAPRRSAT